MISCLKNDCAINLRDPIPLTTKAHLRKTLTSKLLIEFAPNENTSSEARNLRRGVCVSLTLQSFAKRSIDKAVTRLIYLLFCFLCLSKNYISQAPKNRFLSFTLRCLWEREREYKRKSNWINLLKICNSHLVILRAPVSISFPSIVQDDKNGHDGE